MKIIKHRSLQALINSAWQDNQSIYETDICFSYRIFENKQTKEFHVFALGNDFCGECLCED